MSKRYYSFALIALALGFVGFLGLKYWPLIDKHEPEYAALSHFDLLNASDVIKVAKQSIKDNDLEKLNSKLDEVISVAKAMPLNPQSIDFLQSPQAHDYVVFQAKRAVFDDLLEIHFKNLKDIEALKRRFPEAKDKFAQADRMMSQRDTMLEQIREALEETGMDAEMSTKRAAQLWKDRFSNKD